MLNERLKSLWVLDIKGNYPQELDKAKKITFLTGKILEYKKPSLNDDEIQAKDSAKGKPFFVLNEKKALTL